MTWLMIALLMGVFVPFLNIIIMAMVTAEALNKIALREDDD